MIVLGSNDKILIISLMQLVDSFIRIDIKGGFARRRFDITG